MDCTFHIRTPNEVSHESGKRYVMKVDTTLAGSNKAYYIVGGTDRDRFTMTQDGELEFINAPDVNNPIDRNSDNIYRVQVKAVSDEYTDDYQTIKVTVEPNDSSSLVPTLMYLLN